MKTTARRLKFWVPVQLLFLLTLLFPRPLASQGALTALNVTPPGLVGYLPTNGVGWSFVPTSDLLVTAISSTAPQVSFWQGSNQVIATYSYAGPYGGISLGPSTNFQAVSSLLLFAGQTYFISCQNSNFTTPVFCYTFGLNGADGLQAFTPSPYISQFASYLLSAEGQWSSPVTQTSENVNYLFLGPNFEFQAVPEPTTSELSFLAIGFWFLCRRTILHFSHVRQIRQLI
jgi:hypothetical protein